ncbi:MAG TPA: hypothetical protein VFW96_13260 [Thermomicrobiales bacterium]|nr:hypothetical protein [Thermomicrobiales bacterium]
MPRLNGRGALARLGSGAATATELVSIVREMSFDDLRDEAQAPPQLLLVGADREALMPFRDALGGEGAARYIDVADFDHPPRDLHPYDGIVLVNAGPTDRARPEIQRLLTGPETAGRTLTFQTPPELGRAAGGPAVPSEEALGDLRRRLLTRLSHRQLALGRHLPAFRHEAAGGAIGTTARANAEFAFLANIPSVIPLIGGLMAAGADSIVLTKNQLMLLYKLAAIHGRDLHQPGRIYAEMLPVVGAGLVWRTVARELASFIPFAAGTIPKVVVAYAGTAVTGQAANFYYEQGKRPDRAQLRRFYERAAEMASKLPLPTRDGHRDAIEADFQELPPREHPAARADDTADRPEAGD